MTAATLEDTGPRSSNGILHRAVHRNGPATMDGFLERLFTLSFGGLVYPQIWEDPAIDLEAMEIAPHHHIVAIASGGWFLWQVIVLQRIGRAGDDPTKASMKLFGWSISYLVVLFGAMAVDQLIVHGF